MIDRFGNEVLVAWADHEVIWIEAALTLPIHKRKDAFRDIAYMCARTFQSVERKAYAIRRAQIERHRARVKAGIQTRGIITRSYVERRAALPSMIAQPSRERLMAGRSTYSPTTGMR